MKDLPSRNSSSLLHTTKNVLSYAQKGSCLPKPLFEGAPAWSCEQIISFLEPIVAELGDVVAEVQREEQESKGSLTTKWQILDKHSLVYNNLARIVEAFARIAREEDLAERMRARVQNARKNGSTEENPENDTPVEPQPTPANPS